MDTSLINQLISDSLSSFTGGSTEYIEPYVVSGDTIGFILREVMDTVQFVGVIDTLGGSGDSTASVANYTELRDLDNYESSLVVVNDWTYTGPDGNTYTTIGGIFKKVSTGSENGGTIIEGNYIWAREWDKIHVQPEWWEVGGIDYKNDTFTNKNIDGSLNAAPKGIYNERDRLQSAIQTGGQGSVLNLYKDKLYTIDVPLELLPGMTIQGNNAIFKRMSTPTSLVSANALSGASSVTLTDASSFRAGQVIMFVNPAATYGGTGFDEGVGVITNLRISDISGNVVTFTNTLPANVNIGYRAIITGSLLNSSSGVSNELYTIKNLHFDGNKSGNPYCYDWRFGANVYFPNTEEQSVIENCYFYDTPAENIFAGACKLINSRYSELNGSLIHFSANINRAATTVVDKVYGVGSNRGTNAVMNHSEAVITSSANTTNVRITNCNFEDGDEAILISDSYDDFEYSVENCNFKDFKWTFLLFTGGGIEVNKNIRINNNMFDNCGPLLMSASSPSSIYKNTGNNIITISNNFFINTRIEAQHVRHLTLNNNHFVWNNDLVTKYDYSVNTLNGQNAFHHFINFDRLHIINNTFEYPDTFNSITQYGLLLQHNSIVRKTSAGADTEYLYAQDVKVNGNTFAGFKFTICTVNTTGPQNLNLVKQAVGWEYKNNIIYTSRNTGSNNGTAIFVDPGVVCEGNTIYTNSTIPLYTAILVAGVGTAGNAHNRLIGGIAINNKVLGCTGATAADIVANADGVRYNVTCINNMTRDDVANATNGYFTGNYKLTTALYPQLSAMTCPEWRYYGENADQY
jgi:hypothetical protein